MLVQETGDSKSIKLRIFRGFLVNSFEPIEAWMGDEAFLIAPSDGVALFIQQPDVFRIPSDVVVVGVENGENFRHIRRQKYLFGRQKVLFVSRYPQSSDLRDWLIIAFPIRISISVISTWRVSIFINLNFTSI